MSYTAADYEKLLEHFEEIADKKYLEFHGALVPGREITYGIRLPEMRKLAKEIVKDDPEGFLSVAKYNTYEEIQLCGIVIATMKTDIGARLKHFKRFIPHIDNWAICDTFCTSFKPKPQERERVWEFMQPYFASKKEYDIRFAVVMFLAAFVDDEHIDEGLSHLESITNDAYYVQMAVAWAVSVCFVKQREKTLTLLKAQKLDKFTQNKSIQKIRESFRADKEDKDMLLAYKIK